jgi:hypothetical protein
MPVVTDLYQSKYLKAADLAGMPKQVVIANATLETFQNEGESVRKVVLHFAGMKPMVINKTNWQILEGAWSNNTDNWLGKQIMLVPSSVSVKGQLHKTIRIEPLPAAAPVTVPQYTAEQLAQMQAALDAAKNAQGNATKQEPAAESGAPLNDGIPHM